MESHNTYGRYIDHINCEVWDLGRQIPHNDLMGYDNTTAQPNRPRSTSSAAIFERSVENGRFTVEGRANRRNETLYDNSSDESDTEFISLLTTDGDDWTNDRRDCGIPPPAYDELSILSTSDDMHHDRTEESVTHCESLSRRDYYIANGHPRRQNVERPPDYFTSHGTPPCLQPTVMKEYHSTFDYIDFYKSTGKLHQPSGWMLETGNVAQPPSAEWFPIVRCAPGGADAIQQRLNRAFFGPTTMLQNMQKSSYLHIIRGRLDPSPENPEACYKIHGRYFVVLDSGPDPVMNDDALLGTEEEKAAAEAASQLGKVPDENRITLFFIPTTPILSEFVSPFDLPEGYNILENTMANVLLHRLFEISVSPNEIFYERRFLGTVQAMLDGVQYSIIGVCCAYIGPPSIVLDDVIGECICRLRLTHSASSLCTDGYIYHDNSVAVDELTRAINGVGLDETSNRSMFEIFDIVTDDKYSWVKNSCGIGPVQLHDGKYCTTVTPADFPEDAKGLSSEPCIDPDVVNKLNDMISYRKAVSGPIEQREYEVVGCDCDRDNTFVERASAIFVQEFRNAFVNITREYMGEDNYYRSYRGDEVKEKGIEQSALDPFGYTTYKPRKHSKNIIQRHLPSCLREPEVNACGTCDCTSLFWHFPSNKGTAYWIRVDKTKTLMSANWLPPDSRFVNRQKEMKALDEDTERIVAVSTMHTISNQRMEDLDGRSAFSWSKDPFFEIPANDDARCDSLPSEKYNPAELGLIVFAGTEMRPVFRTFFLGGRNGKRKAKNAIITEIERLSEQLVNAGPSNRCPYVIVLTEVESDLVTGAMASSKALLKLGGIAVSPDALYTMLKRLVGVTTYSSIKCTSNLRSFESRPTVGTVPYRFAFQFGRRKTECYTPRVIHYGAVSFVPLPSEETSVLGSEALMNIPDQATYARTLTACRGIPPVHDYCLGLLFPIKGIYYLSDGTRAHLGQWCQRFLSWLQWGEGSVHYENLRKLVPLCDCFISDVVMNCNYFKYGFLFHLHCLPCQRREKLVVEILRRAIEDAQKYKSTSTWFNVYRYTRDDY
uniref:LORF11 n=1 Tax=anatid alphaherpesvirus 1 TaxID=104388 RepID=H9U326_9ALPH|nr:LORF11 [Anatid alphaherpesvirus 1]